MRAFVFAILIGTSLTSGCATAIRGTSENVQFESDPAGAEVTTDIGLGCRTPCNLNISRSQTFNATFTLAGQKQTVFVDTEIANGTAAIVTSQLLLAPLIIAPVGVAIDAVSGANLTHTPNPVRADFRGALAAAARNAPGPAAYSGTSGVKPAPLADPPVRREDFPEVPGSPPLYEGSRYAEFSVDQISAYCNQNWDTRIGAGGRTEYNPCNRRDAFR